MTGFYHDVRTTFRGLLKTPAFAIVTILTLAVAIGANTAIFSIVDGVLVRPLPYPDADRLVRVAARTLPQAGGEGEAPFSDRGYWHFFNNNRSFERFGGIDGSVQWALTGEGPPIQVEVARMTASAFELIGALPQRGRFPTAEEDRPDGRQGGARIVLLSDALWRTVFGSDPAIIGRTVELNGYQREVIGVMPPGYDFPTPETDVWIPSQLDPASKNFGGHHIQGIARLAPGATLDSATADAKSLIARFGEIGYGPTWFTGIFSGEARVWTLKEEIVGDSRQPLLILLATMGFVLLIACSNVANLFNVRAEARARDTAVRMALGSGRRRLIRLHLTEGVVLGLLGGAFGVLLAYSGVRALVAVGPASIPRLNEIGMNPTVLAFTASTSVAVGLLVALIPALGTGSSRMLRSLRGGRSGPLGRERHRVRSVLVVTQVGVALALFVGATLMMRSFAELRSIHAGFDPSAVLTFRLSPSPVRYETPEAVARFYDELLVNLRALPGVSAMGAINTLPLTGGGAILTTQIEEFPPAENEFPPVFLFRRAAPGYFESMGIPLVEGRTFTPDDHNRRLGSLIISKSIKDKYWPNVSALGKRLTIAGAPGRVVGVIGDVHDTGLGVAAEQFVYKPMLDEKGGGVREMTVTVRSELDSLATFPAAVRNLIGSMDPGLPVTDIQSMESIVGDSLSRTSFTMSILTLAAAIALFLGAVGIYGVISYGVSQRTGEIGLRQAVGASPDAVRRLILRDGVLLGGAGVVLGLVGAVMLSRVLSSLLYGVSPYDAATLAGGAAVFLGVAALASVIPAARAARIPPSVALLID